MRGSNVLGRFDPELEIEAIRHGIAQDLPCGTCPTTRPTRDRPPGPAETTGA